MASSTIRYATFPRTIAPDGFADKIVAAFRCHETEIATHTRPKGLTSDQVLQVVGPNLAELGFQVESGKRKDEKIHRPVFFGENGQPTVRYEIDAFHPKWRCGLEIEAGRAWMGNAVYRDLIQSAVMVDVDCLCLAVSNVYRYRSGGKTMSSRDYENTVHLADALFGHSRLSMPYRLIVIGY